MEHSVIHVRVLLVEDEDFSHEIVKLYLSNTKYQLISAKSVSEAKNIITSQLPDIVITDAMMPGESGFSLISWMKKNPRTRGIPIILWTMMVEAGGQVMDASNSADILMSKPFCHSNILETLEHAEGLIKRQRSLPPLGRG
ncbi:MAG TPA: response regulator [Blastocatellia bacterium]|nr:response regulator [Blastocatellia bacterium]